MSAQRRAGSEIDLSRLPAYARGEIERLRAQVAFLQERLAAGPNDSDTFADPYAEPATPLGRGIMVRFGGSGHQGTFDVSWTERGELLVRGNFHGEDMAVIPQSQNTVRIHPFGGRSSRT